ncbi:hypothetical protein [Antarcticimicrobium sediminis]|uniref:Uncharacterized protein n=1 Tax=Antarcticimicrobium sediminis TaxID=2546227 RepID=A0A4R5EXE1_9RHOB|nr:hypothetical protein [Antarcticimicrobium sediminis]TDE39651.1 hypothetical protein E1B25_06255 [Antarcticimicrobium sediminis]
MPPLLLIALGGLGIAGFALLLRLAGRSRRCVLTDEMAESAWLRHFPDDPLREVTLAHDGHAALILSDLGTGLLWSHGAGTVARRLVDYDLFDQGDHLRVVFHDFTAPAATIKLDPFEHRHWLDRMQA